MHEESKSNQIREETARLLEEAYVREDICHQSDTLRYGFLAEDIKENWTLLSQQRGLSNRSLHNSLIQINAYTTNSPEETSTSTNKHNSPLIVFRSGDEIHSFVNKRYHHSVALKHSSQPLVQTDTTCVKTKGSEMHVDEGEQYSSSKTIPGSGYILKLKTLFGGFASTENRALYKFHTNYNDLVHELEEASQFNEKDDSQDDSIEEDESSIEEYSEEEDSVSIASDVSKPAVNLIENLLLVQNANDKEDPNLDDQMEQAEVNEVESQDQMNDVFGRNYMKRLKKRDSLFALRHLTDQQPTNEMEMFDDLQFGHELEALMIPEEGPITEGITTTDAKQFFRDDSVDEILTKQQESVSEETLIQVIQVIEEEILEEPDIREESKILHETMEIFHQMYHAEIMELPTEETTAVDENETNDNMEEFQDPDDSILQKRGYKESKGKFHPMHRAELTNGNEENSFSEEEESLQDDDSEMEEVEYNIKRIRTIKTIAIKKQAVEDTKCKEIVNSSANNFPGIQNRFNNESSLIEGDGVALESDDGMEDEGTSSESYNSSRELTNEIISIMNISATTEEWSFVEDGNAIELIDMERSQDDIMTPAGNFVNEESMDHSLSKTISHIGGYYCDSSDMWWDDFESEIVLTETHGDKTALNHLSYNEMEFGDEDFKEEQDLITNEEGMKFELVNATSRSEEAIYLLDHVIDEAESEIYSPNGRFLHEESLDNSFSRLIYHVSGYYCSLSDLCCDDFESEVIFKDNTWSTFTVVNDLSYYEIDEETEEINKEVNESMTILTKECNEIPVKEPLLQNEAMHILEHIIDEAEQDLYSFEKLTSDERKIIDHEIGCIWIAPILNYDVNEEALALTHNQHYHQALNDSSFYEVHEDLSRLIYKRKRERGNLYHSLRSWFDHHSKVSTASCRSFDAAFPDYEGHEIFDNGKENIENSSEERYFKIVMTETKHSKVSLIQTHLAALMIEERNQNVLKNHKEEDRKSQRFEREDEMSLHMKNHDKTLDSSQYSTGHRERVQTSTYTFPSIYEYDTNLILEAEEDFDDDFEEEKTNFEEIICTESKKLKASHSKMTFNKNSNFSENGQLVSSNQTEAMILKEKNPEESFTPDSNHQDYFVESSSEVTSHGEILVIRTTDQTEVSNCSFPNLHTATENNLMVVTFQENQLKCKSETEPILSQVQHEIIQEDVFEYQTIENAALNDQSTFSNSEKLQGALNTVVLCQENYKSSSWALPDIPPLPKSDRLNSSYSEIATDWGTIVHHECGYDLCELDTFYLEHEVEDCVLEHQHGHCLVSDDLSFYEILSPDSNPIPKQSTPPPNDEGGGGGNDTNSPPDNNHKSQQEKGKPNSSNRKNMGNDKKKRRGDNNRRGRQKALEKMRVNTVESESCEVTDVSQDVTCLHVQPIEELSSCSNELSLQNNIPNISLPPAISPVQDIHRSDIHDDPPQSPMNQLNKYHISVSHIITSSSQQQIIHVRIWLTWSHSIREMFNNYLLLSDPHQFSIDYDFYKGITSLCDENVEALKKMEYLNLFSDDEEQKILHETQTSWSNTRQLVNQKSQSVEEICQLHTTMKKIQKELEESESQCNQQTLLMVENEEITPWGTVTLEEYVALLQSTKKSLKMHENQLHSFKDTLKHVNGHKWNLTLWMNEFIVLQDQINQQLNLVNQWITFCSQTVMKQNEILSLLRQNEKDIEIGRIQLRNLSRRREQLTIPFHEMGCEFEKCKFTFEVVDLRMKRTKLILEQSVSHSHPFVNRRQYLERRIRTLTDILQAYWKELMHMTGDSHVIIMKDKKRKSKHERINLVSTHQPSSLGRWNIFWKVGIMELLIVFLLLLLWTSLTLTRRESSYLDVILPRHTLPNVRNS